MECHFFHKCAFEFKMCKLLFAISKFLIGKVNNKTINKDNFAVTYFKSIFLQNVKAFLSAVVQSASQQQFGSHAFWVRSHAQTVKERNMYSGLLWYSALILTKIKKDCSHL